MPRTAKSTSRRRAARKRRRQTGASGTRPLEATLAALAHDIRTPLTSILALGDLLATSDVGERERSWAAAIKGTAEHLNMLTSLIVDAGRAKSRGLILRRVPLRPRQLAEALAVSLAARTGAKALAAEVAIAADLPEVVIGDPLRLRCALENLLDNAVKFTDRGSVRLEVSAQRLPRGRARLVFAVIDSGIGLNASETRRLFRPFVQANDEIARRYGGAGLGLALVQRVAKAMHGDLTVASRPGRGSTFRLTATVDLVTKADAMAADEAAMAPRSVAARALKILCVEDNPYGRVILNTILTELGHRANFVGSGEAAVAAVAGGGYDVVLMDVTLPDIDGFETTRRIRALPGRRVPVIGISGHGSTDEEARAHAAGMDEYLAKPINVGALARVLPE